MERPPSQQQWGGLGPNEALKDLVLEVNSASYFAMEETGFWPLHQHLDFELIMVVAGRYEATLNGVSMTLGPGQVLFVQPEDWHEDHCLVGLEYCAIHGRLVGAARTVSFLDAAAPVEARVVDGCDAIVRDTLDALRSGPANAVESALQNSRLQVAIWSVLQRIPVEHHAGRLRDDDPDARQRSAIRRAFEHHYAAPVAMAQIAAELGISERQLRTWCARLFGTSPAKAYTAYRLGRAREHIRHTTMSITEVAHYFGFATPFHFSRLFKATFGVAPSHLREQQRGGGKGAVPPE